MKNWLWDYSTKKIYKDDQKNRLFELERKVLYGSDRDLRTVEFNLVEKADIPVPYKKYMRIIQMKTEKSVLSQPQGEFLRLFSNSSLREQFIFTGGTALSEYYLKHRYSEDMDFFSREEFPINLIEMLVGRLRTELSFPEARVRRICNRTIVTFENLLTVQFDYMPYDFIETPKKVGNLMVDSLVDIGVNKIHAILERAEPKDFVDLYFIAGYHKSILDLVKLVGPKFGVGYRRADIGAAFLKVNEIKTLPRMIKEITIKTLVEFFTGAAEALA